MITVPHLRGRHCLLRELVPADAAALQRHADDPAVSRNLVDHFPHPYTLAHAQAWCGGQWREPAFGFVWGIDVAGEVMGCIAVVPPPQGPRSEAEVGYWIGQTFWRRGIASDALGLVTRWAWEALPEVTRLTAPIFTRNVASQGVATQCGYGCEAALPQSVLKDGVLLDRVLHVCHRPA